jgi:hypothetical protein
MKRDLLTNEPFEPTRSTMNFINASNRIKFYNLKAKKEREAIAYIQKPLIRNKRILDSLMKDKKEITIHREYLRGLRFNFNVLSSFVEYNGGFEKAVFEYIILREKDNIKILKK